MKEPTTLVSEYQSNRLRVSVWLLEVVSYRLGEKYVCIVSNVDPGSTICRTTALTRRDALKEGLEQANAQLSRTVVSDRVIAHHRPPVLERVEIREHGRSRRLSIEDFNQLEVGKKMEYILAGVVTFYDTTGAIMTSGEAISQLSSAPPQLQAA